MLRLNFAILLSILMHLSYAQTIGIGTDYPQANLHIVNNSNINSARIDVNSGAPSIGLEINQLSADYATYTVLDLNNAAHYTDLTSAGGIGSTVNLQDQDGTAFFAYNLDLTSPATSTLQGDEFLFDGFAYSVSVPSIGNTFGGVYGADQYGNSVVMHLNQWGGTASNTLLFTFSEDNPEPTLRIGDSGYGGGLRVTNDNDNPPVGVLINASEFYYSGSDISFNHTAVYAESDVQDGVGIGVYGSGGAFGLIGEAFDTDLLNPGPNFAVFGLGELGSSGTKNFFIDLPSDPENFFLKHFALESDEALNVYRGIAVIGRGGRVKVSMPDYFSDININFTYHLTSIGSPVQPFVARKMDGNSFMIGGRPGSEVSWLVLAERNDPYLSRNPEKRQNIVPKTHLYKGKYLHPELYDQPKTKGIFYRPEVEDKGKQTIQRSALKQENPQTREQQVKQERIGINQEIRTWDELDVE